MSLIVFNCGQYFDLIVYIRSGSLDHMSVAIKMVKRKPVLITYKDEMMLISEKIEAMKLRMTDEGAG